VTPALARILPASLFFSSASASSSRSTVTKLSPAFSPAFSAVSNTRARPDRDRLGRRRRRKLSGAWRAPPRRGQRRARIAAGAVDQAGGEQPFGVVEQDFEQVLGRELLMSLALGERLGRLDETAAAVGIFLEIHEI
jgi:hypothetical protein